MLSPGAHSLLELTPTGELAPKGTKSKRAMSFRRQRAAQAARVSLYQALQWPLNPLSPMRPGCQPRPDSVSGFGPGVGPWAAAVDPEPSKPDF